MVASCADVLSMSDRVKIGHHDLDVKQKASIYSADIIRINFVPSPGAIAPGQGGFGMRDCMVLNAGHENLKNHSLCNPPLIKSI